MEFKEIFNPLKKCLGDGHDRPYFFRDLMAMITTVTEEEWGTEVDPNTKRIKDNTILNFIKRGLSKTFAQSIVNRLTPDILMERINERPLATREALARELSLYDESLDAENVAERVAAIMVRIITKSAGLLSEEEIEAKKTVVKSSAKKTKTNVSLDEADEIVARAFLISHEQEKELIPLCQIAFCYSPEHKHCRSMYTEFILLPPKIQRYILKACDAELLADMKSLFLEEALERFCADLEEYQLSTRRYLYMFNQYLYRAFDYYSDLDISNYDIYSFTNHIKSGTEIFKNADHSSIDKYIDDYLWMKENNIESDALPPMDYLWLEKDFGSCEEAELTFWLCRFVIDSCNNLYYRVKSCEFEMVYINDRYAETQEDLYYCALNSLYNLYMCHSSQE
ncbi:hypothetical protein B0O40_1129 [Ruminococcaceae bacterium R-25]|nr:hypothetical protein B0O40_1129 [Ruminococcaceae bacterium R-25]SUQ11741.1 hypothetical protein SAMN06297423_1129 [Oscillospiraceae bacterium]